MSKPDINQYNAEIDLFIYALDRWQVIISEISNPAQTVENISFKLIKLKRELWVFRRQSNHKLAPKFLNYQSQVNELIADLEQLKLSVAQLDNSLNNIIALQEKLEVLQERQSIIPRPNYHHELIARIPLLNTKIKAQRQYNIREKLWIFKLKYPENFWAGFIAIVLGLVFVWRFTAEREQNLFFPDYSSDKSSRLVQKNQPSRTY